jgi:hypothetical protein
MTFQFRLEGTAGAVDNNTGEESSTGSGRRQFFVVRGGGCTGADICRRNCLRSRIDYSECWQKGTFIRVASTPAPYAIPC